MTGSPPPESGKTRRKQQRAQMFGGHAGVPHALTGQETYSRTGPASATTVARASTPRQRVARRAPTPGQLAHTINRADEDDDPDRLTIAAPIRATPWVPHGNGASNKRNRPSIVVNVRSSRLAELRSGSVLVGGAPAGVAASSPSSCHST